jgi:biopolymer transport protein ExbB
MIFNYRFVALAFYVAIALPLVSHQVHAQAIDNNAPIANEPVETTKEIKTQSLGGMVVNGGTMNLLFFGVLGIFSLWAVTVVFERIFNLRRDKMIPLSFTQQLIQLTASPQSTATNFQMLCQSHNAPASRILKAGVSRSGRPLPEVEKAMEDAAAREMAAIRAKNRPLSVVGNVAPLVGLLGTVVGMIMAFQVSSQEGLGKAERLAEGIYLALMTTAAGLTIAIPCLMFASWFSGRAERYMCEIGECLTMVMPSFARMEGQPMAATNNPAPTPTTPERQLTPRERFLREAGIDVVN